jgi:hypothetical protein
VVDCVGKPAGRIESLQYGSDLRHADRERHVRVYGGGTGQRIACADGVGTGVHHGERGGEHVDNYVDEPGSGEKRKLLQCDAERKWRNSGIYVVDCVGKLAGRAFAIERRRNFRDADGKWHGELHGDGDGQRVACADGLGE